METTEPITYPNEESIRVAVSYPDGKGNHETTISEIRERFIGESDEWLNQFISDIMTTGTATTRHGGRYDLVK